MHGSITIEMHFWAALVTILVTAASAAQPEEFEMDILKARILANLGMTEPPDMSAVNTSDSEMQMMTREYEMRVRKTEEEVEEEERVITPDNVITYNATGCRNETHVLFRPELSSDIDVKSARIIFPDNTTRDVSFWIQQWREFDDLSDMVLSCWESHCCQSRLELKVRRQRGRQTTCTHQCCRRHLRVSFKKIGWDWVVLPSGIDVSFCKGECSPSEAPMANVHALVQRIFNHKGGRVPMPSCVPKRLKSMHLMHYDAHQLVLTEMKDMIVQECACA